MARRSDSELDRQMGVLLRHARIVRGHTLQQVADLLGITYQQVQKYEKGTNRITVSRLIQFASALNVNPQTLMPSLDQEAPPTFGPAELRAAKYAHRIQEERILAKWLGLGQYLGKEPNASE